MRCHGSNDCVHPLHQCFEAEVGRRIAQPVACTVLHLVRQLGALDQGLAGHAAIVQTIAAHFVRFDQGDLGFDCGRNVGRDQPRRTGANHDQIAVKLFRLHAGPSCINLALANRRYPAFCEPWKDRQQQQTAQQRGAEDALRRVELRQLGACIHDHRRARQHAQLTDRIVGSRFHAREAHQQVDQKERHHRYQAQGQQVISAFFVYPRMDRLEAMAKARLNPVAQHKARGQKRQRGAQGRSK